MNYYYHYYYYYYYNYYYNYNYYYYYYYTRYNNNARVMLGIITIVHCTVALTRCNV